MATGGNEKILKDADSFSGSSWILVTVGLQVSPAREFVNELAMPNTTLV